MTRDEILDLMLRRGLLRLGRATAFPLANFAGCSEAEAVPLLERCPHVERVVADGSDVEWVLTVEGRGLILEELRNLRKTDAPMLRAERDRAVERIRASAAVVTRGVADGPADADERASLLRRAAATRRAAARLVGRHGDLADVIAALDAATVVLRDGAA